MEPCAILTTRKRAIIALVHSVVFLIIACFGLGSRPKNGLLYPQQAFTAGNIAIFCVYVIVSSVLLILTRYSGGIKERAYFAFCSASASVGLLRALFGDPVAHVGPVARVLLLATAVAIGFSILNADSQPEVISAPQQ
jgi:hypothetical protein